MSLVLTFGDITAGANAVSADTRAPYGDLAFADADLRGAITQAALAANGFSGARRAAPGG